MGTTGKGFRYPQYADTPDVPRDLGYLAADVDAYLDAHPGPQGPAGTIEIVNVITVDSETPASVENIGTAENAELVLTLPRGVDGILGGDGPAGPPNVLETGTVTTGDPGTSASVVITGTSPSQTVNFTIPRGDVGPEGPAGPKGDAAATVNVGTTLTGNAGTNASVTNSGTSSDVVLNFTIPRGATGATGPQGPEGPAGLDGASANINPVDSVISLQVPNAIGQGVGSSWYPYASNSLSLGKDTSDGGLARYWKDIFSTGTVRAASVIATGNMYINTSTIVTSDINLKNSISGSDLGLSFIESLNPVKYKYNVGGIDYVSNSDGTHEEIETPGQRYHYGLIAQEVKEALDIAGVSDFGGWVQREDSTQALRYEEFVAPLIKAVQELSARLKVLEEA